VITFLLQRYVPYFEECRNSEGLCLVSNVQQLQEDSRIRRKTCTLMKLGDTPHVAAGIFSSHTMIELVIPKFIITPVCDTNK
jgi:hypothetical protein